MAIPDVAELREFLSGIRLAPEEPFSGNAGVQLPFMPAIDETGRISREPHLWLHYPNDAKITLKSVIGRINRELNAANHPRHDEFSLLVLAIASLMPSVLGGAISRLNRVLAQVSEADVSLYYILFAGFPRQYNFEMPPFRIGPLSVEKLRYSCDKVGSDFYARYRENLLRASWAVERAPHRTRSLNIPLIREIMFESPWGTATRRPWELRAWEAIVNAYFSLQNQVLFDDFLADLISVQSALLTLGAPYFDPRSLSTIIQSQRVAVFQNLGRNKEGFVAPSGTGPFLMVDFSNVHQRVPGLLGELKSQYGFAGFNDTPLHRTMKLFADFVSRARRHEIDGRQNEAFLHFVIALELLLGDRQMIEKSVAARAAVITFRENNRSFEEQRRLIGTIYELRSRYVHSGSEVEDEAQVELLRRLCEQVFRCLLRLQATHAESGAQGPGLLAGWCRELDYIAAGLMAGKSPSEAQLSAAFVQ